MERPKIIPENHEAIYDYYDQLQPSQLLLRSLHKATGFAYTPTVHFADGAEDALQKMFLSDTRLIIASNHIHIADQLAIASVVEQQPVLRPLIGNTFVLAKAPYFQNRYIRPFLEASGGVPVFRPQDMPNYKYPMKPTLSLIGTSVLKIVKGQNMLIFPEGTRNRGNPAVLGEIQKAVGWIARGAGDKVPVSILPVALWFKRARKSGWLKPHVYVNTPLEGPFMSNRGTVEQIRAAMEESLGEIIVKSAAV